VLGIVHARAEPASILRQQLVEPFLDFAAIVMARLIEMTRWLATTRPRPRRSARYGPAFSRPNYSFWRSAGEADPRERETVHMHSGKIVSDPFPVCCGAAWLRHRPAPRGRRSPCLCHLLATVENGIVASKPQEFRPQPPTVRLVTGYVSMRCGMLRVNDDTFTMISGLIVIAVGCIAGLLALG
jgi:hypothetical protein